MSDLPATLPEALVRLQAQLPTIKKSETAEVKSAGGQLQYKYNYANLATISDQLLPLLSSLGLSFSARPTLNAGGTFVLAYSLRHVKGDSDDGEYPLPTSGTPQAIGSAITYARRYALCSITGVAPEDDDDDAAVASQEHVPQNVRQRTAQRRGSTRTGGATTPSNGSGHTEGAPPLPGEEGFDPSGLTPTQLAKLGAAFTALGVTDRARRLKYVGNLVGRPVESAKELTNQEAGGLMRKLNTFVEAGEDGPILLAEAEAAAVVAGTSDEEGGDGAS